MGNGLVVADSGDIVSIPLLWKLLDSTRTVIGFAWDTTGSGSTSKAPAHLGAAPLRRQGRRTEPLHQRMGLHRIPALPAAASIRSGRRPRPSAYWFARRLHPWTRPSSPNSRTTPRRRGTAPLKIGLSSKTDGAAIYWSTDSSRWNVWSEGRFGSHSTTPPPSGPSRACADACSIPASCVAHSTYARRRSPRRCRRASRPTPSFHRAPYGKPTTVQPLSPGVALTLDSGASLTLNAGCVLRIEGRRVPGTACRILADPADG